jgi:hypothetical protein
LDSIIEKKNTNQKTCKKKKRLKVKKLQKQEKNKNYNRSKQCAYEAQECKQSQVEAMQENMKVLVEENESRELDQSTKK